MRRYRSYKFTDKHHSKGGVRSSIAAAISLICTVVDIQGAYAAKGNAGNGKKGIRDGGYGTVSESVSV